MDTLNLYAELAIGLLGFSGVVSALGRSMRSGDGRLIENGDNITVAPWGDLIVCEDGTGDDYLVGVRPDGEIYKLAHNLSGDGEFAGCCFSPDGTTLFVNMQSQGYTLAITGDWGGARLG